VRDMWQSGARGSLNQITQMVGMKGLIASTSGGTIEFPIISSTKEGLTPIEYFISTHGSRKGLTDTALNTAKAGYLTRRLFDVAQDAIIALIDCKTKEGIPVRAGDGSGIEIPLAKTIKGRYLAEEVKDGTGTVLFPKGHFLSKEDALRIEAAGVLEARVRSPLSCEAVRGICQTCYGMDLGTGALVELGEAVGTVAAQAIGEPATQLTMRTFHTGGTASIGGDITVGLPRVDEVFERRLVKNPAVVATVDGVVSEIREDGREKIIVVLSDPDSVKNKGKKTVEYQVYFRRMLLIGAGDTIKKGDRLTDGSADISELFKYGGKARAQQYIITETSKIYELQGASVARKHIEVIVRQMFDRVKVKAAGESNFVEGDIIERAVYQTENERLKTLGLQEMKADALVMGISEVSLSRQSFFSAASFQHTTKTLIRAAVRGSVDKLRGLKENVLIGRLIPAGTGFPGSKKEKLIREEAYK